MTREQRLEYFKQRRKKLTEQGLCTRCSVSLDVDADRGYKNCINCREHLYNNKSYVLEEVLIESD